MEKYWIGSVGYRLNGEDVDDFGVPVEDEFVDGRVMDAPGSPWAIMSRGSWRLHGSPRLGTGWGQRYRKQADGRWLKVEG